MSQESRAERSKRPKPSAREKRSHVSQISNVRSPCERNWKPDLDEWVLGGTQTVDGWVMGGIQTMMGGQWAGQTLDQDC